MAWQSWYTSFSDAFKKRAGRYLINKYLGTFLDETISLDQLSVDGAISLSNVALNIPTINSLIEDADLPVEFVDGYIQELSVTIPWTDLLNESCYFSITGLTVTLQVKKRANPAQISASIFHSMCESFSSFSVAEECMKQEDVQASPGKKRAKTPGSDEDIVAGVELLAQAIDSVIMRVQVKLCDSTVRLEHLPGLEQRGIALELQVGRISYSGEQGAGCGPDESFSTSTVRRVCLEDVSLATDEFQLHNNSSPCTSVHSSRTASVSPNADRGNSRDFVWQGLTPEEREEREEEDRAKREKERRDKEELDLPLKLATLAGKQEIVLKFTEMNQFGLPRAVDEVEVGLGNLLLHVFPHQVHILSEILSAVTVPATKPAGPPPRHPRHIQGLEGLLQENLRLGGLGGQGQGLNLGWGEDLEASREFLPVAGGSLRAGQGRSPPQGVLEGGEREEQGGGPPPMPRILIRVAGCVGVVHERDPGVARLGGEPTKALAMRSMRTSAATFFTRPPCPLSWEARRLAAWHSELGRLLGASHVQLLAQPITVHYQEGTSIGPGLSSTYAAITTVTLGKVSVVEYLAGEPGGQEAETVPLLAFSHSQEADKARKTPDVKIVYKDTLDPASPTSSSLSLAVAPCSLSLDPGLLDRTYLLLHYSEMDPECVRTLPPSPPSTSSSSSLATSLTCSSVSLQFWVPKPDMRGPQDLGRDLLKTLWGREVHPEVFLIQLSDLCLKVCQEGGGLNPLTVSLTSSALEVSYQESPATQPFCLVQARRLQQVRDRLTKSHALNLTVTVCMDPSLALQGRYNSRQQRMEKSVWRRREGEGGERRRQSPEEDTYFVVDPEASLQGGAGSSRPGFLQQQGDILAALRQALLKNNLLIDICLDAVSLVIPGKRLYELVYNRLGNDLLLWLPQYLAVKQHLYGERPADPLHDDTQEFSDGFQGRPEALQGPGGRGRATTAFPKDREAGALEIHTDTAVSLTVNQAQVLVCLPMEEEGLGLVHLSGVGLSLTSAVGLDKEPEISIFSLSLAEGCVKYGLCARNKLPAQLHFNPGIEGLEVLVTTNSYCDRAWPEPLADSELLSLTGKVLLDSGSNLKSIQLAFLLARVGLCVRDPALAPDWVTALAEFFTVVEFPVLGYVPPAVLSELHFQLLQCAVEVAPPAAAPAAAALCIGKASVSCSLLDTTKDASVSVSLEDVALYLSREGGGEASVCVADVDYLDLGVTLSEPESAPDPAPEPTLLVTASANMVRLRTCADTLQLLAELAAGLTPPESQEVAREEEVEEEATLAGQTEDMLPDLEDAMVELTEARKEKEQEAKKEKERTRSSSGSGGAQVFFFPGESSPSPLATPLDPMTQSVYLPQHHSEEEEEDEDLESFCILEEEEGSGIVPSGGGPGVRVLTQEGINIVDNHFSVPDSQVDHLRPPKGFPLPQLKLSLTRLSLVWQIFGGNDFSASQEMACNTRATLEQSGLCLSPEAGRNRGQNSPRRNHQASNTNSAVAAADRLKVRGGPGRNSSLLIEVAVTKMAAQLEVYPLLEERNSPVSRQILLLPSFEIRDRLVGSEINKLLHSYSSKTRPRQSSANMLHVRCLSVRPDPASPLEEASLKVSLQPFRLNIDQDTLFFIIDFANTLMPAEPVPEVGVGEARSSPLPGQAAAKFSSGMQAIQIEVPDGAEVFEDARSSPPKSPSAPPSRDKSVTPSPSAAGPSIYFKSFIFSPAVPIRVDYVGKYVDFTQGAVTGILAGLAQLNCSELTLKQLEFHQGVLGLDKLLALAATAWLADIRSSQLPALLGGVGPMHALLQLLVGVRDLILLPIEQYRKDGRIVRGLQRGTTSFTHSTTLSFLDVTNKLLTVIKFAAELAFDVMSPDGCVVQGKLPYPDSRGCKRKAGRTAVRRARGTPADLREGMLGAMALVREGLDETARSLSDAATGGGSGGALGGVLRAVPSTMVRPIILGAAASSNLLDGMKNQISPDQRAEEEDKWRMS